MGLSTAAKEIYPNGEKPKYIEDFWNKKLSPRSLRLITSVIKEYGDSNYSHSEVEYVIDSLISAGSTWFVDIFAEWLLMIPKKYLDKSTIRAAWNTMLSGLALSKLDISAVVSHTGC